MTEAHKEIPLTQGKVAIVDAEDYEKVVSLGKWRFWNRYAMRRSPFGEKTANGRRTSLAMHRFIINAPSGWEVDHINGDGLDNRKSNLRVCSRAQNLHNQKTPKNNVHGYKGVRLVKNTKTNPWGGSIGVNGKDLWLGCFPTKELAALAYNEAAKTYYGEFARLNFISK